MCVRSHSVLIRYTKPSELYDLAKYVDFTLTSNVFKIINTESIMGKYLRLNYVLLGKQEIQ